MEGTGNRKGVQIFRLYFTKEWRTRGTYKEQDGEDSTYWGSRYWGRCRGKRRFGRDWRRRIWLFDTLVRTAMNYEVEVWSWKEKEGMGKDAREVFVVGSGGEREDARIF